MMGNVKWWLLATVCFNLIVNRAEPSQEIMKKLTIGFSKVLDQCKDELGLGDHIMQDFYKFWREEYELLNRDTGCAIMCIATKLDLVTAESSLHHGNAQEFAMKHGADAGMAKQLVTMLHDCEGRFTTITDDCSKVLEIAKCFRTKIHELKWAPDMETLLEELMIDM